MTDYVICARFRVMQMSTLRLPDADSIISFYQQATGMLPDYMQLSTGPGGLTNRVVELDGVTLIWASGQGRARWRDQITDQGFQFGCMVESRGPVKILGTEIEPDVAAVWLPDQEVDYVLDGPYLSLEIGVSEALLEERGWELSGEPLARLPVEVMNDLISGCRTLSTAAGRAPTAGPDREEPRDRVLTLLDAALDPWHHNPKSEERSQRKGPRFRQLIRTADDYLDNLGGAPLNLADLADSTGTSRRTLHRAFDDQLGVGPRRYYELKRLGILRSRLTKGSVAEHTITELATALGFHDLGRMSGLYRRHYGEYPRDTLLSRERA